MAEGSRLVVYAALAGNLAIAAVKLGAALYTGSAAMLTEAIHSFVDTGNQGLLLYGMRRAERPPDELHPFGHGLELYFWSFVVALLIFALGGAYAIYEGIDKIRHPGAIESPLVNFAVIGVALVFEGISFLVAWREMRGRFSRLPLWQAVARSKDPSTFAVILEDGAALIGLVFALAGISAALFLKIPAADGIASVAIGALLVATALVLAREVRSLLTGEAASPDLVRRVTEAIRADARFGLVGPLPSLQLGPRTVVLVACVRPDPALASGELVEAVAALRRRIEADMPSRVHLALDLAPGASG